VTLRRQQGDKKVNFNTRLPRGRALSFCRHGIAALSAALRLIDVESHS